MRIIVRYCAIYGNYVAKAIEIDPTNENWFNSLKHEIFERFQIKKNLQLIKYFRDGFNVLSQ